MYILRSNVHANYETKAYTTRLFFKIQNCKAMINDKVYIMPCMINYKKACLDVHVRKLAKACKVCMSRKIVRQRRNSFNLNHSSMNLLLADTYALA